MKHDVDAGPEGSCACGGAAGVVGGFAGGERGVQQFVEQGDIDVSPPGTQVLLASDMTSCWFVGA